MREKLRRGILTFVDLRAAPALALALLLLAGWPFAAQAAMRALVIGIDDYAHVQKLSGAVADARDIEKALRGVGATDITALIDGAAGRRAVIDALDDLAARTRPDDMIFITLAGNGGCMPERSNESRRGFDAVFLLRDFDPHEASAAKEKILGAELADYVRRLEAEGGRVIVVIDAGSGGEQVRAVDPRGRELRQRSVAYALADDVLKGAASAASHDFQNSLILAATDGQAPVAELKIPGQGARGALSFAFARALEGSASAKGGGPLTAAELVGYVRQVTHELSDQRQNVALRSPESLDLDRYVVVEASRGIAVRPFGVDEKSSGELQFWHADRSDEGPHDLRMKPEPPIGPPIKLASLDGRLADLSDLAKVANVTLVAPNADPDLVWDPNAHDVLAGSDVIARNIPLTGLPGVIDRMSILNALKKNVALHAQPVRILPGDDIHHRGSRVEIDVGDLAGRNLVLFDLTGVGEAQLLYPLGSDPPQRSAANYTVELQVREPFGADLIVAVTSNQSLSALVDLFRKSGRRLSPSRFSEALAGVNPQGLRIGYVGLFTTP